jgi:hypothetical protein
MAKRFNNIVTFIDDFNQFFFGVFFKLADTHEANRIINIKNIAIFLALDAVVINKNQIPLATIEISHYQLDNMM